MDAKEALEVVDDWGSRHTEEVENQFGTGRMPILRAMYSEWKDGALRGKYVEAYNILVQGMTGLPRISVLAPEQALLLLVNREGCRFDSVTPDGIQATSVIHMSDAHGVERRFHVVLQSCD